MGTRVLTAQMAEAAARPAVQGAGFPGTRSTLLSMLLIRRHDAREAARQTKMISPYTGRGRVKGRAFRSLGLEVLMPEKAR